MTATQQIENFTAFAKAITQQEGEDISLDEIFDRWWQEQHRNEDLEAIQAAEKDYENGDPCELARDVLNDLRAAELGTGVDGGEKAGMDIARVSAQRSSQPVTKLIGLTCYRSVRMLSKVSSTADQLGNSPKQSNSHCR